MAHLSIFTPINSMNTKNYVGLSTTVKGSLSLKPKLGVAFIVTTFLVLQTLKVWQYIVRTDNPYITSIMVTTEFVIIAFLIFIERKNLADFCLDRFSIVALVLVSIIRMRFQVSGENFFLGIIGIAGFISGIVLITRWPFIPKSDWRWIWIGLLVGCILAIPVGLIEIFSGYLLLSARTSLSPHPFILVLLNRTFFTLSFASVIEEIIFRGFLWGYLLKIGLTEKSTLWTQSAFFG